MKNLDIAQQRQINQHLVGKPLKTPGDIVSWLGAVQAQDYAAAKWALGARLENGTDKNVEEAYNKGEILRTHVMRPTWHFVSPKDIRWMLALTASRVNIAMGHYNRKLELDSAVFKKTNAILQKALFGKNYRTRQELKELLENDDIQTNIQRLAHIIMYAELEGIVCSGPRRGKQFTYALLSDRAPRAVSLSRDESLAELALRYFRSHGPAQAKDFAWWSGLTVAEATKGLSMNTSKLQEHSVDGKTYWFSEVSPTVGIKDTAHLLSIYDEYTIAYKDRSALGGERYAERLLSMGNALTAVIVIGGKIVGTWKRELKKDSAIVRLNPFISLTKTKAQSIREAADRYGTFLGVPVTLSTEGRLQVRRP